MQGGAGQGVHMPKHYVPKAPKKIFTRRQRKFLQGAKADLHCDTMVQICGATPPPPMGGSG